MDQDPAESPFPFPTPPFDNAWIWLAIAAVGAFGLLLVLLLFILWRRLSPPVPIVAEPPIDLGIDVTKLPVPEPHSTRPQLELYGTPVRVVLIVLAPVGRDGALPNEDQFLETIEQLIPSFSKVVINDRPSIRGWPSQLSSQGFAHAFFNNVPLPGDRGRGTPWCSLVGKFSAGGEQYLAGIVCRSSADNALGQYLIQHEGQWNDVLRIRKSDAE